MQRHAKTLGGTFQSPFLWCGSMPGNRPSGSHSLKGCKGKEKKGTQLVVERGWWRSTPQTPFLQVRRKGEFSCQAASQPSLWKSLDFFRTLTGSINSFLPPLLGQGRQPACCFCWMNPLLPVCCHCTALLIYPARRLPVFRRAAFLYPTVPPGGGVHSFSTPRCCSL